MIEYHRFQPRSRSVFRLFGKRLDHGGDGHPGVADLIGIVYRDFQRPLVTFVEAESFRCRRLAGRAGALPACRYASPCSAVPAYFNHTLITLFAESVACAARTGGEAEDRLPPSGGEPALFRAQTALCSMVPASDEQGAGLVPDRAVVLYRSYSLRLSAIAEQRSWRSSVRHSSHEIC